MRHPFAEIMLPEESTQSRPHRRRAMSRILSLGAAAVSALVGRSAWGQSPESKADEKPQQATDQGNGKSADGYALYLVVPKSIRKFTTARRKELGVDGPYVHGWEGNDDWKDSKGFLAWNTKDQYEKILDAEDVKAAHAILPEDKLVSGNPNRAGGKLTVIVMPNAWPNKPDADQYHSVKQIAESWTKQFKGSSNIEFKPAENAVEVHFKKAEVDKKVTDALAAHAQVSQLAWAGQPTTRALGEEGGQTTLARFEEGGGPTTRRLGEEGGIPPRPTTLRAGEEGATTLALGEEGGGPIPGPLPRPVPRPLPGIRVTTKAIGEEG